MQILGSPICCWLLSNIQLYRISIFCISVASTPESLTKREELPSGGQLSETTKDIANVPAAFSNSLRDSNKTLPLKSATTALEDTSSHIPIITDNTNRSSKAVGDSKIFHVTSDSSHAERNSSVPDSSGNSYLSLDGQIARKYAHNSIT